jgi:GntR family transcriptional repressor for pyruvate dehydrogenase complex
MQPIKRITVTDNTIEAIKQYLLSGNVKRGVKLMTENELAERLGVGRSTVREAIRTLQAMGYIEIIPNKGAFAVITSSEEEKLLNQGTTKWIKDNINDIDEFFEIRKCLEPFAARLAATRIDGEKEKKLLLALETFKQCCDAEDKNALAEAEINFHTEIFNCSGNQLFIGIYKQLHNTFKLYAHNSYASNDVLDYVNDSHRKIYMAIVARQPDAAESEMVAHIEASAKIVHSMIINDIL